MTGIDRSKVIFGNAIDDSVYKRACRTKQGYLRRFGDDSALDCKLEAYGLPVVGEALGVRGLRMAAGEAEKAAAPRLSMAQKAAAMAQAAREALEAPDESDGDSQDASAQAAGAADAAEDERFDIYADAAAQPLPPATDRTVEGAGGRPIVIGNIRMGFGHYRIAMAMASAAHAMGYTPYWLDLMAFPETTCSKIISSQNDLYSMGSRLSQRIPLFNDLVWEPLNSEGFRKLEYNASDQKAAELMTKPFEGLPADVPFIGTHAWTVQAAVHAGLENVVNAIPDNWPMALHLAEGAIHTVQTPFAYEGYRTLNGMDKTRELEPMPEGSIFDVGHYVDHELVVNIEADCARRRARVEAGAPLRFMLSVGGAGAQQDLFCAIISHVVPLVEAGKAALVVNVGDHLNVWNALAQKVPGLAQATCHFDDIAGCAAFAEAALDGPLEGIHAFYHEDIFAAVYSTNLLMRACDILITKPSELSFYPVPKMMIKRVGGHEAYGAIRASEVGDGTVELETPAEICGFIDLVAADPQVICDMCANIEHAKDAGIYDGAYKVVELATR